MIRIFSYSKESNRMETPGIAELPRHLDDRSRMIWVDLEDPNDDEAGVLGGIFGFHVLAAEDCIDGDHLPKVDLYDETVFLILHAVDLEGLERGFETLEVGVFIGDHYLVTYHKKQVKGIFDSRGQVAKNPGSLLRSPDWLLHSILDAMVDNYMLALEHLETRIGALEAALIATPEEMEIQKVLQLKREVFHLQRVGRLQTEILGRISVGEIPRISEENRVYFRDIYDHLVRVTQSAERDADRLSGALSVYQALTVNRTDRAVRALAVSGLTFVPLLWLSTVFGMNFSTLPWLANEQVYYGVLGAMVLIGAILLGVFKKKGWF